MFLFAVLAICSVYGGVIPLAAPTVVAEPWAAGTVVAAPGSVSVVSHSAHAIPLALSAPVVATHVW